MKFRIDDKHEGKTFELNPSTDVGKVVWVFQAII